MDSKSLFRNIATKVASNSKGSKTATSKSKKSKSKGSKYSKLLNKSKKPVLTDTSDAESDILPTVSSENFAKLPTLTEEEYIYFKLVQDGDLNGLKDFIASELYARIHINKNRSIGKGFSALHYAVRRQDDEMVTLLLAQEGILIFDTILHAIQEENIAITMALVAHNDANPAPPSPKQSRAQMTQIQAQPPGLIGTEWPIAKSLASTTLAAALGPNLSPTAIRSPTLKQSYQDLDEFDSEFPEYITPLMKSAQIGNEHLMEIFYSRCPPLETAEEHHNCGCGCATYCSVRDKTLTTAYKRLHLFQALTNPNYICFLSGKMKNIDPINYAMDKIKRCSELIDAELAFDNKYQEYKERLSEFIKDFLSLCRSNKEAETFFAATDTSSMALRGSGNAFPRLWTVVGLQLIDVVAHPHAQNIVYKEWTSGFPEWDTYGFIRKLAELILRSFLLPVIWLYLMCASGTTELGRKLRSPVSRYLNWIVSYIIFLAIVYVQAMFSQRCNNLDTIGIVPYSVDEGKCDQRGAPNIGTEWPLVLYVLGFFLSMLKRQSIPWFWDSSWSWYELVSQLLFVATFVCWIAAYFMFHPLGETRKVWGQYYPEVLAEVFFSVAVIFAFGRTFRVLQLHRTIGPLQIALGRMVKSFFFAGLMYSTVIFAFSLGLNAIYIPYNKMQGFDATGKAKTQNSPFGNVLKAPEELFWSLFGMSGSDKANIVRLGSKVNSTALNVRHHWVNETAGKLLFAAFHILGVVMMFNMLVAYFSAHGEGVMANADAEWKFARTQFYMTFIKDTVLPPPYNLIPTLRGFVRFINYIGVLCLGDGLDTNGIGKEASCSLRQCCFIEEHIDYEIEKMKQKSYKKLILELTHRYKGFSQDRENQEPATSDDVKEIGEELAELKSQVESKLRELEAFQASQSQGNADKPTLTSVSSEELNILQDIIPNPVASPSAKTASSAPKAAKTASALLSKSRRMIFHKSNKGLFTKLRFLGSEGTASVSQTSSRRMSMPLTSLTSQRTLGQASILPGSTMLPTRGNPSGHVSIPLSRRLTMPPDLEQPGHILVPISQQPSTTASSAKSVSGGHGSVPISQQPSTTASPAKSVSGGHVSVALSRQATMVATPKNSPVGGTTSVPLSRKPTISAAFIKSLSGQGVPTLPTVRPSQTQRVNSNGGLTYMIPPPPPPVNSVGSAPRPPPPIPSVSPSGQRVSQLSLHVQASQNQSQNKDSV